MNPESPTPPASRQRTLFLAALEIEGAAERAAFLSRECGKDPALRRQVEELLGDPGGEDSFMARPAVEAPPPPTPSATVVVSTEMIISTEKPGDHIGPYKILQQIGEGGCGLVYMAEQQRPVRRRVALKVIKLGMDTRSVIARFEAERQALALMEHPNIARVLDAGATTTGRPYFVMELVRGIKITDYCDQHHLPTHDRLQLFIKVCHAIQHAHQKGIIHRDIKPSNILVTLHDGNPVPKVIDFGIAKATEQPLTDKTLFTEFQSFIGTPAYMSPEQAELSGLDIDTRSDIYALGVLLYQLLTGRTPFDAETLLRAGIEECRRTIREEEPVRPSTRLETMLEGELTTLARQRHIEAMKLILLLRGDLDWVVMKCLEKDRTRRYATANELAQDVACYLEDKAVQARPPSNVYRFRKFMRRHRGAFAAGITIVVILLAAVTLSTWLAVRAYKAERAAQTSERHETQLRKHAEEESARAEYEKGLARLNEYVADINLAQQSLAAGNLGRAVQLIKKHFPQPGEGDLRGFEWRYLWQLCQGDDHTVLPGLNQPVEAVAFAPHGKWAAIGGMDKVSIVDLAKKTVLHTLRHGAMSLAVSPDGSWLVTVGRSGVRLWRTQDWSEQKAGHDMVERAAFSRDGRRLAVQGRRYGLRILTLPTLEEERKIAGAFGEVAFSPDGTRVAAESDKGLTVWSPGQPELVLENSTNFFSRGGPMMGPGQTISFSPDGTRVLAARATVSAQGVFVVTEWDSATGQELGTIPANEEEKAHTGVITDVSFSPDGRTLATASRDHSIGLWDFKERRWLATVQGHVSEVAAVAFSPDGLTLLSGSKDGAVKLWSAHPSKKESLWPGDWQPFGFSRDGKKLLALGKTNDVFLYHPLTHQKDFQFQLEHRPRFGSSPLSHTEDLGLLARGQEDGTVELWNTETRGSRSLKVAQDSVDLVALSPDGTAMITGRRDQNLRLWDLRSGTAAVLETDARRVLFSPDSRTFALFSRSNHVEVWCTAQKALLTRLAAEESPSITAVFSPDGRILAAAGLENSIRLFEVDSGKLLGTFTGHKQVVSTLAFSPDGRTLASASADSTLKLWNVASQQELISMRKPGAAVVKLFFSPDGALLVGGFRTAQGCYVFHAPAVPRP